MGKDEPTTKKRRKLNTSSNSESSKQSPDEVYKVSFRNIHILCCFKTFRSHFKLYNYCVLQKVVDFEESESKLRPAEKDATLFKKICQDVRQIFADIAELKAKGTEEVHFISIQL